METQQSPRGNVYLVIVMQLVVPETTPPLIAFQVGRRVVVHALGMAQLPPLVLFLGLLPGDIISKP